MAVHPTAGCCLTATHGAHERERGYPSCRSWLPFPFRRPSLRKVKHSLRDEQLQSHLDGVQRGGGGLRWTDTKCVAEVNRHQQHNSNDVCTGVSTHSRPVSRLMGQLRTDSYAVTALPGMGNFDANAFTSSRSTWSRKRTAVVRC